VIREESAEPEGSIAELQQVMLESENVRDFLAELARQAARLVPEGLSCGMTMQDSGRRRPVTVACSDDVASEADEAQYESDAGPCLTAMRTGQRVTIVDMAKDRRWRRFSARAESLGIRSCLALPLQVDGEPLGALNLYGKTVAAFGPAETRQAEIFVGQASVSFALCLRLTRYSRLNAQLRASMESRAIIDQAIGVIMSRERCPAEQALTALRAASQRSNVKLRDIATVVVASVSGEAPTRLPAFEE
jgi:GAF domain-containing protein